MVSSGNLGLELFAAGLVPGLAFLLNRKVNRKWFRKRNSFGLRGISRFGKNFEPPHP